MESLWEATAGMTKFSSLRQGLDTDVLIIGGGMAGLLCAWMAPHRRFKKEVAWQEPGAVLR